MSRNLFFVVFMLFGLSASLELTNYVWLFGKCYDIPNPENFDSKKFLDGRWFEIEKYTDDFEKDMQCITHEFIVDPDTNEWYLVFTGKLSNGTEYTTMGKTRLTNDSSYMEAKFPNDSQWSSFRILATDYDNFAIIYSCAEKPSNVEPIEKQERLWILGRNSTFSDDTQKVVNEALVFNETDLHRYTEVTIQNCTNSLV